MHIQSGFFSDTSLWVVAVGEDTTGLSKNGSEIELRICEVFKASSGFGFGGNLGKTVAKELALSSSASKECLHSAFFDKRSFLDLKERNEIRLT